MSTISSNRPRVAMRLNPISGAVALALGSMTLATDVSAADTYFDDEMVVTSTRRDASVQEVPFNMAAFSGDTLESQRLNNLAEFARWVPGLTFTDQGPRASSVLTVRGLSASSIRAPELLGNNGGDTVSTYVGEIPVFVDLKPYDLERVEVLIGPLYGAGTLAGAVRYIPAKPNMDTLSMDTHVKTYLQSESQFNVPIISDVLAFRGLVGYVSEPGYIDYNFLVREAGVSDPEPNFLNPTNPAIAANLRSKKDANDEKTFSARAALLWNLSDALNMYLRYDYQNKKVGARSANNAVSFDTGQYVSGQRFLEPNQRENHIVEFSFNWDFGFAELTSATGYSAFREIGNRDQTDLLLNFEYGYESFPAFAAFTRDASDNDTITQEIRLVSQHEGPFNWIVGGFYSNFKQDAISEEFAPGIPEFFGIAPPTLPTGDLEFLQLGRDSIEETAFFGELGWQITERWQTTVGARVYEYDTDSSNSTDLPLFPPGNAPFGSLLFNYAQFETDDSGVIGKFNTSLALDDWIPGMSQGTAYATISQGYRIGGANLNALCVSVPPPPGQNICITPDEQTFDPDKTINYELGLKSTWFDGRWLVNVAGFYIDWSDVQLDSTSEFGDVTIQLNASDAISTGIELQSRLTLFERLSIYGAYAYTNAELSEDAPGIIGVRVGSQQDAFDGDRLPGTPENQGSLNFSYDQPLDGDLTFDINYGLVVQSDVYTKAGLRGNGEALPGFATHHFSTGVSGENWSVSLFVDNLFDKYAVTGVRDDRDFIDRRSDGNGIGPNQFTLRRYIQNVIRPRTVGLNFTYDLDL